MNMPTVQTEAEGTKTSTNWLRKSGGVQSSSAARQLNKHWK